MQTLFGIVVMLVVLNRNLVLYGVVKVLVTHCISVFRTNKANLDDLKNNGIPVKVRYTPQSRTDWVPTEEILTDMAQFGLLTNDSGDGKATHEDWEKN